MKIKATLLALAATLSPLFAWGQVSIGGGISAPYVPPFIITSPTTGQCLVYNGSKWANASCGGGGGTAFSALTSGTNTAAAMLVGSGASLAATGSGTITATAAPASGVTGTLAVTNGGTGEAGTITGIVKANGTSAFTAALAADVSAVYGGSTGTGLNVLQTSPTLITPNLGTPSAINLTNGTALPLSGLATQPSGTDVSNCTASMAAPAACSKALSVPSSSFQGLASVGSNIATRQAFFGQTGSSAAANYTFASQIAAEAPFEAVKLIFVSYSSSYNIGGCTVSATAVLGSTGTSDTWTPATFSTGKVGDLPPTYASTTATFTVPAPTGSGDNLIPGWAASDWISVSSISRTDGGTLPLLAVRCWMTSSTQFDNQAGMAAFNALSTQNGRVWWTGVISDSTGVYVSAPASHAFAPSAGGQWVAPIAVQFAYTNVTGLSLVTVGDSLIRGQSTSTRSTILTPYAQYAVNALSTTSRPITLSNMGWSGQSHDASYRNTLWAINNLQPDVILFSVNSVNDGTTDFSANGAWNHALATITQAKANGIIPIIVTQLPSSGWNSTTDTYRVAVNNKVRALAGAGVYVLDADSIVTTGTNPGRLQAGYDSGDGEHPNAAGDAAIGTALQTILTTILNGR